MASSSATPGTRKKVDERVRTLIANGVHARHRSFFVMVGDHGKEQVANLHYVLTKSQVRARPSVLWCYSKELGFSTCVDAPPPPSHPSRAPSRAPPQPHAPLPSPAALPAIAPPPAGTARSA